MNTREMLLKLESIGIPDTVIAKEVRVCRHTIWSIKTGRTSDCYTSTAERIKKVYETKKGMLNEPK